jgi:hypothetical protein
LSFISFCIFDGVQFGEHAVETPNDWGSLSSAFELSDATTAALADGLGDLNVLDYNESNKA